jgi:hypothetical protein
MRRRTLNIYFSWLVVAMVYYGLSFNTKNIGANIYVSNFVSGFAEIVACVLIIPGYKNVFSWKKIKLLYRSMPGPHKNGISS